MTIDSSKRAYSLVESLMSQLEVEEIWAIALSSTLNVLDLKMLFRGTLNQCQFHPRDLFRFIINRNAACFILLHNHPSGDPRPTKADRLLTNRLVTMSLIIEIPMRDHLIVTDQKYFSFADAGLLKALKGVNEQLRLES